MDRDTALHLAVEAKLVSEWGKEYPSRWQSGHDLAPYVERFAALVAAHERERILEMCKEGWWDAAGIRHHLEMASENIRSRT